MRKKSIFICFWRLKFQTNYFKVNYTFSVDFCKLDLFCLVLSDVVVCLAMLVFYHPWLYTCIFYISKAVSVDFISMTALPFRDLEKVAISLSMLEKSTEIKSMLEDKFYWLPEQDQSNLCIEYILSSLKEQMSSNEGVALYTPRYRISYNNYNYKVISIREVNVVWEQIFAFI